MPIRFPHSCLALAAWLTTLSCATSEAPTSQPNPAVEGHVAKPECVGTMEFDRGAASAPAVLSATEPPWRSTQSASGAFSIAWRPLPDPIVTGEPFQLEFRVRDAAGLDVPLDTRVFPDAAMPMHGHGMTRQPLAVRQPDGSFLASGLLFHMAGDWLLSFDIQAGADFDRATDAIALTAGEAHCAGGEHIDPELLARILELSPLPPPPFDPTNAVDDDPAAAHLGQFLFFDERLSGDGQVSCASCHMPSKQWDDGKPFADVREPLERNTPVLWNLAYGNWFFWDGRADTLWSQALKPLEDEREHAGDRLGYAHLLHSDPELRAAYEQLFGALPDLSDQARFPAAARPVPHDPQHALQRAWAAMSVADQEAINHVFANIGKAIAAFERLLISSEAPFDRYVRGLRENDAQLKSALSISAERGLDIFLGKGACHSCHRGPNFSDKEFHNTRLPKLPGSKRDAGRFEGLQKLQNDPFQARGIYADSAAGRALAAEKLDYLIVSGSSFAEFKTPTLRNVALSAPYMHNGMFETLAEVIEFYSDEVSPPNVHAHQERVLRPALLSAAEKADLLAFLEALSGEQLPAHLLEQPESPKR